MEVAAQRPPTARLGVRVPKPLLLGDGTSDDGAHVAETAQAVAEGLADLPLRIVATVYLAGALLASGNYRRAEQLCLEIMPLLGADPGGDRHGLIAFPGVMSRSYLAWALANRGAFHGGIDRAEEALGAAEASDHPDSVAMASAYLALIYIVKGEIAKAIGILERGLALCREWRLAFFSALAAEFLGHAYAASGRVMEGLGLLQETMLLFESMRIGAFHAFALVHVGEASARAGRLEDGLAHARRALTLARERGEHGTEATACRLIGELVALREPSEPEAHDHYHRALDLAEQLGMRPLVAHCHLGLGLLDQSREHLAAAATMYREMDMRFWLERAEAALRRASSPAAGA